MPEEDKTMDLELSAKEVDEFMDYLKEGVDEAYAYFRENGGKCDSETLRSSMQSFIVYHGVMQYLMNKRIEKTIAKEKKDEQ